VIFTRVFETNLEIANSREDLEVSSEGARRILLRICASPNKTRLKHETTKRAPAHFFKQFFMYAMFR
jgi:hypothetical protein